MEEIEKNSVKEKLRLIDIDIKKCEDRIKEIESSLKTRIFSRKELKQIKADLIALNEKHDELFSLYNLVVQQEKLMRKKEACKELLESLKDAKTYHDESGKEIAVTDELLGAFISDLNTFQMVDALTYSYKFADRDSYSINEEFCLNSDGNVDIRVTTNDKGIAAKNHVHYKTVDEMLNRYSKHLNVEILEENAKSK